MDITGLGYLGFETTQLEAWRSYGPEVMGFQIGRTPEFDPESLYFKIDDCRNRFALHPGTRDRLAYIGWQARGRLEFIAAVAKFRATNVELTVGDAALCDKRGVKDFVRFVTPWATSMNCSTARNGRRSPSCPAAAMAASWPMRAAWATWW